MCVACLERARQYRENKKAQRRCSYCGGPLAEGEAAICSRCRKKDRLRKCKRKSQGLCITCGSPSSPDRNYCEACLGKIGRYREARRAAGICKCGKPAADNKSHCEACLARIRAQRNAYKQDGLCRVCGEYPPLDGRMHCEGCLAKVNQATRELTARRAASGQCATCGEKLDRKGRRCHDCLAGDRSTYEQRKSAGLCVKCGAQRGKSRAYCDPCLALVLKRNRQAKARLKVQTFEAYGGCSCACCGETGIDFLTIDHIGGGGNRHRQELFGGRRGSGYDFYGWLKKQGYPPGYQVLCFNCNFAKWKLGECPHQVERAAEGR